MSRVLVLIPTFNEEANLPFVLGELRRTCGGYDVLVIDDGSSDGSGEVARAHGAVVLRHDENRGYGAALVTGYRYAVAEARHDRVARLDADGQHNPAELPGLIDELDRRGGDLVIGSRMLKPAACDAYRPSLPRLLGIRLFAWLGRRLTGQPITDPTSGLAVMNRRAAAFLVDHTPDDFPDLNVRVDLSRAGFCIHEVPVAMRPRRSGRSMLSGTAPLIYPFKILFYLFRIYRRSPGAGAVTHDPDVLRSSGE